MFETEKQRQAIKENELLEIFILLEGNTYAQSREAAERYRKLENLSTVSIALVEAQAKYKTYLETGLVSVN